MTDLPPGWELARLDEIAEVRLGRQRSPKNHSGPKLRPYLRAANVGWNGLKLEDVKRMNFSDAELETYRLQSGDILVSEASGSAHEVGKSALWRSEIEDCCFQNTLVRVRSYGSDPKYLLYFLRHEVLRGAFAERSRGVGIYHIGATRLAEWRVPLPPLAEQYRIVAALENHISHLDQGVDLIRAAKTRLEALRAALAAKVLIPGDGWNRWRIGKIAHVGSGATPLRSRAEYYEGGTIPWITSKHVNRPVIDSADQFITERALQETAVKLWPSGTLLVAMYGEGQTRGRCSELLIEATTNQACAAIVLHPEYENRRPWLRLFFEATYGRNRRLALGGVQPNLSLGLIKGMEIWLPPIEIQEQVLSEVDLLRSAAERLQQASESAMHRSDRLRRALLAEATAGRLVPQNSNDEPASEVLARSTAEREALLLQRTGARTNADRTSRANPGQETLL